MYIFINGKVWLTNKITELLLQKLHLTRHLKLVNVPTILNSYSVSSSTLITEKMQTIINYAHLQKGARLQLTFFPLTYIQFVNAFSHLFCRLHIEVTFSQLGCFMYKSWFKEKVSLLIKAVLPTLPMLFLPFNFKYINGIDNPRPISRWDLNRDFRSVLHVFITITDEPHCQISLPKPPGD